MNRLIIIGNGFDMAHDLPTSYGHFIDDFWKNIKNNYNKDLYKDVVSINESYNGFLDTTNINNFNDFKDNLKNYSSEYGHKYSEKLLYCSPSNSPSQFIFNFRNEFFKKINSSKSSQNWVDIENEYYTKLKDISKLAIQSEEDKVKQKSKIELLNREFEQVKVLFEIYLNEKIINLYKFEPDRGITDWHIISKILKPISLFNNETKLLEEFINNSDRDEIENLFEVQKKDLEVKTKLYFLNFNYTPTLNKYTEALIGSESDVQINFIHGELNDKNNLINFGFGDEMDEDYKNIENINDNEYLINFKSFQYLQTSNYKNLLDYINSGKFQVYIMGHSCGLSDRTLLNTIFEHKYCCSIKVYYHKFEEPKSDGRQDDYTQIVQNISRHFKNKIVMRERIVNKSLCTPLPQNVHLPLKIN